MAALGAAGLIASLWLPWYSFRIPAAAIDSAEQAARQLGALGPLVTAGAQIASQLGPLHVTAWQVLNDIPAILLVVGVVAGGVSALAVTGRAGNVARLTELAGVVGIVLVGYRLVSPPVGGLLNPAWGLYLAAVGAVAIIAGGAIAGGETPQRRPDLLMHQITFDDPPEWSAPRSTPPPAR